MAYKKFKADRIFDGYRFLDESVVLITKEDGTIEEIIIATEAGDDIQKLPGILSPGLINCHCHLELSHLKGLIPEGTGLVTFLTQVMTQRAQSREVMMQAIEKAEDEMIANGIVAVGDICNTPMTLVQKSKGRLWYHNFIELAGAVPEVAEKRFKGGVELFSAFAQLYSIPIESISLVPHAPYSITDELLKKIVSFPGNHLLTIHNQESAAENEWSRHKTGDFVEFYKTMGVDVSHFISTGKSSLQSYLQNFLKNQSLILTHNVETSEDDLAFAKASGIPLTWCLCPGANRFISGQLPAVDRFMKNECVTVLGTDSLASNHHLSILAELQMIRDAYPAIAIDQLLLWATSNGAKALQMDKLLGSFETGKRPGVILFDHELSKLSRLL
ncbi:MAG: amidohydrolase family protein [Chitinophagaceae bacterium]|nr:amidohydrolase family protein [Chitinophagaceae bacterium]